jgi:hypothetical protein
MNDRTPHKGSLVIPRARVGLRLTATQAQTIAELAADEQDVVVTRIRRSDDVRVVRPSEAREYRVGPDGAIAQHKSASSYLRAR